jgi:class 3 adenylate cyclase
MKSVAEYTSETPSTELYHFLSQAIIRKGLQDFSSLLEFAAAIPIDEKTAPVFEHLFVLIRRLHWGFFCEINPRDYPAVWREIVLPHKRFPGCGDLKRNLTISNIFVGILDLHGYTGFCDTHKNNLSMLRALDTLIQVEMTKLAKSRGVVLQRRNGDEMVLVGTRACDLIDLTLDIIEVFEKKKKLRTEQRLSLPDMYISAGIAGGNKFTPFIITMDGDLSGGVVNTAARLQSRANELSGFRSRLVVGRTVHSSYLKEVDTLSPEQLEQRELRPERQIHFIDSGCILFKGLEVPVCEVLFDESDMYRIQAEEQLQALIKAVKNGSWREGVFETLLLLLIRLYKFMPTFRVEMPDSEMVSSMDNESFIAMAQRVLKNFKEARDYSAAFSEVEQLVAYSALIPDFDPLSLEYAQHILERYRAIVADYEGRVQRRTRELADTVLPDKYRQIYATNRKAIMVQERLDCEIRRHMPSSEVSQLWRSAVGVHDGLGDLTIRSGKQ